MLSNNVADSVESVHRGTGDSSVMCTSSLHRRLCGDVGLIPSMQTSLPYPTQRQTSNTCSPRSSFVSLPYSLYSATHTHFRENFLAGVPPPDFPGGKGESDHIGRPTKELIREKGGLYALMAMGFF